MALEPTDLKEEFVEHTHLIEYIQTHLDSELNLSNLANLIYISPHYFASLFKTINRFITS